MHGTAPGRVNLIGEHTDYNGGFVLPAPIARHTRVVLTPRRDRTVRVASGAVSGPAEEYRLGEERPGRGWLDYIQGVTRTLAADGHPLGGFEARIESDLPLGGGLSSSASLTVALMRALRAALALDLSDVALALAVQRAEVEFVGARVRVMDPMAIALGRPGAALFLDTRALIYEHIPLPGTVELVVLNSGVSHSIAGGGYNARRAECERAAALLGVPELRDVTLADLPRIETLPTPLGRRARHVVTENARVLDAVAALRGGDLDRLRALFAASHASMRDDYEVSVPEIDLIVELAMREPAIVAARLTGGGFGGSVVMLAHPGEGRAAAARVAEEFERRTGTRGTVI